VIVVRRALEARGFRWLWLGQLASQLGNAVFLVMGIWEIQLKNPVLLSVAGLAMMLPQLLAAAGGVLVDRLDARRLMLVTDILRGVGVGLGLLLLLARPEWQAGIIIGILAMNSLGGALFNPAEMVVLPRLVEDRDLPAANGLSSLTWQVSSAVGSAIGGAAIAAVGASLVFGFDLGTFWFSALAIGMMMRWTPPVRGAAGAHEEPAAADDGGGFRAGWAVIRGLPWFLRLLPLILLANFLGNGGFLLLPYWVRHGLHAGPVWFGLLDAAWAGGMVAGSLLAAWLGRYSLAGAVGALGFIQSLMVLGFALIPAPAVDGALLLVAGAANGSLNALMGTALQRLIPLSVRGRAFGLFATVLGAANPAAALVAGLTVRALPVSWWFLGMALSGVLMAGAFWRWLPKAPEEPETLPVAAAFQSEPVG
jgi:DHA3 family macrolide efflux protein-like MFS transporter